ncbi:zinc knuckle [Oesophagostomum dentatum]|uniref:Zinc knuckle n=1 Tax=Oesophagostomum dentatum TaxID=61180 RepID=A0A0B1TFJ6_OESDE|nr:zinc knuckle [Oesophagostomum dentatum]
MAVENEEYLMKESTGEEEVRLNSVSGSGYMFPDSVLESELRGILELVEAIPGELKYKMEDHRVSARYKEKHNEWVSSMLEEMGVKIKRLMHNSKAIRVLHGSIAKILEERFIETEQEWEQYICTMERDGEVLPQLCNLLNTDMLQIVNVVNNIKQQPDRSTNENGRDDVVSNQGQLRARIRRADYNEQLLQDEKMERTGISGVRDWKPSTVMSSVEPIVDTNQQMSLVMLNYIQSLSCVDPGVYRGGQNESFRGFIRRFKRKYGRVVTSDRTLMGILGDDHLDGRAKSVFLFLPESVKRMGFENVVEEMGRLLSEDSVAGRMRAIAELRDMRIRPDQDVADFCIALEKLGRRANPEDRIEDRSLEFARILLSNLKHWPEHVQLLSALHKVKPEKTYEEVKQLAVSIELAKKLYEPKQDTMLDVTAGNTGERPIEVRKQRLEKCEKGSDCVIANDHDSWVAQEGRNTTTGTNNTRKCFNCCRYGHIARECPQRRGPVNEVVEPKSQQESKNMGSILESARNLGVRTAKITSASQPLLGEKLQAWTKLMDMRVPAMLDTGSMISIIPVGLIAQAKRKEYDIESLKLVEGREVVPVCDASGNLMKFLGAVKVEVKLETGRKSLVAFHIADTCEKEVLLGTNSLRDLGIEVVIGKASDMVLRLYSERKSERVDRFSHSREKGAAASSAIRAWEGSNMNNSSMDRGLENRKPRFSRRCEYVKKHSEVKNDLKRSYGKAQCSKQTDRESEKLLSNRRPGRVCSRANIECLVFVVKVLVKGRKRL